MNRPIISILGAAALGLLSACTVGPDYQAPAPSLPGSYRNPLAEVPQTQVDLSRWWLVFKDSELDGLIGEATQANNDIRLAGARVREARALAGVAGSRLLPQVSAGAAYSRERLSANSPQGRIVEGAGGRLEGNLFTAGADMNWEIDVFGGTRRAIEAAEADAQAAVEFGREAQVVVLAEVGFNYLELRGLQKELALARDHVRLEEETLALARNRAQAGLASELDPARAEAEVAATRSRIPILERRIEQVLDRLAVLLGKRPGETGAGLRELAAVPPAVPGVPVGLPSDLLRRRPDIRRAERELAAQTARVGEATADLFPKFYLTGAGGFQSLKATDFIGAGSRFWSLGPSLSWPIFSGGRIRQNIEVHSARQEQAAIRYEQTVLVSLEEVENALISFGKEQEYYRSLMEAEKASRRAFELADRQYRGGLVDFIVVLDAERRLLSSQDDLARSERALGQYLVLLYKALGGGWDF
jgi:NodT family efflux transporter outer membrane factor (OMF) lipoprotein